MKVEKWFLILLKSKIFALQQTEGTGNPGMLTHVATIPDHWNLKILTPKQIFQGLLIALAQVKAGNTSQNVLNEICQITYSLYCAK